MGFQNKYTHVIVSFIYCMTDMILLMYSKISQCEKFICTKICTLTHPHPKVQLINFDFFEDICLIRLSIIRNF